MRQKSRVHTIGEAQQRAINAEIALIKSLHKKGFSYEQIHKKTGRRVWFIRDCIEIKPTESLSSDLSNEIEVEESILKREYKKLMDGLIAALPNPKTSMHTMSDSDQYRIYSFIFNLRELGVPYTEISKSLGRPQHFALSVVRRLVRRFNWRPPEVTGLPFESRLFIESAKKLFDSGMSVKEITSFLGKPENALWRLMRDFPEYFEDWDEEEALRRSKVKGCRKWQ